MQDNLNKYLTEIEILHQQQLYRKPITYIPISATKVLKDNEEFLMMASNNYLGLTHHPQVKKAAIKAIEKYGTGSRWLTLDIWLSYFICQIRTSTC